LCTYDDNLISTCNENCKNGYYWDYTMNACTKKCSSKEYSDPIFKICLACHDDCLTCFGPENTHCSSCINGTYLALIYPDIENNNRYEYTG
jgi:hypothetical protein